MEGGSSGADGDGASSASMSRQLSQADAKQSEPDTVMQDSGADETTPKAGSNGMEMTRSETPQAENTPATIKNEDMDMEKVMDPLLLQADAENAEAATDAEGKDSAMADAGEAGSDDLGGSSSETAASLISLAGGAMNTLTQYQYGAPSGNSWTTQDDLTPSDANKQQTSPSLPSIMAQNGAQVSAADDDGKIQLPPLKHLSQTSMNSTNMNSIQVLAELAASKEQSPQQGNGHKAPEADIDITAEDILRLRAISAGPPGADGSPRPPIHHITNQSRQHFMNIDQPGATPYYPQHHQHYPPIKDVATTASPPASYLPMPIMQMSQTPNSANLFAQTNFAQGTPINLGAGRRGSSQSDFQYGTDHAIPQGPSTGETMTSSGPEDVASPRGRSRTAGGGSQAHLVGGGFKCEHPGCKAPPFQTQYLLNSHANVHSNDRPHYCPVQGCPRAEGGKGFKRKNEMIRHGLVHDSPGYICPFCPDREHKYPRPDNLQRHVRVHHMDKDKDDAALRDVLSQRPEGGSRGRRRRIGGSAGG